MSKEAIIKETLEGYHCNEHYRNDESCTNCPASCTRFMPTERKGMEGHLHAPWCMVHDHFNLMNTPDCTQQDWDLFALEYV